MEYIVVSGTFYSFFSADFAFFQSLFIWSLCVDMSPTITARPSPVPIWLDVISLPPSLGDLSVSVQASDAVHFVVRSSMDISLPCSSRERQALSKFFFLNLVFRNRWFFIYFYFFLNLHAENKTSNKCYWLLDNVVQPGKFQVTNINWKQTLSIRTCYLWMLQMWLTVLVRWICIIGFMHSDKSEAN